MRAVGRGALPGRWMWRVRSGAAAGSARGLPEGLNRAAGRGRAIASRWAGGESEGGGAEAELGPAVASGGCRPRGARFGRRRARGAAAAGGLWASARARVAAGAEAELSRAAPFGRCRAQSAVAAGEGGGREYVKAGEPKRSGKCEEKHGGLAAAPKPPNSAQGSIIGALRMAGKAVGYWGVVIDRTPSSELFLQQC
jgi:hypothetical protein